MQSPQPFGPFLFKLAAGCHVRVTLRELVACSVHGREMVLCDDDRGHRFEMPLVIQPAPQVTGNFEDETRRRATPAGDECGVP
jgi:hypothetical protein